MSKFVPLKVGKTVARKFEVGQQVKIHTFDRRYDEKVGQVRNIREVGNHITIYVYTPGYGELGYAMGELEILN